MQLAAVRLAAQVHGPQDAWLVPSRAEPGGGAKRRALPSRADRTYTRADQSGAPRTRLTLGSTVPDRPQPGARDVRLRARPLKRSFRCQETAKRMGLSSEFQAAEEKSELARGCFGTV